MGKPIARRQHEKVKVQDIRRACLWLLTEEKPSGAERFQIFRREWCNHLHEACTYLQKIRSKLSNSSRFHRRRIVATTKREDSWWLALKGSAAEGLVCFDNSAELFLLGFD